MRKLVFLAALLSFAPFARADSPNGRWDAMVSIKDAEIPFRIDFSGDGHHFTGTVFNGKLPGSSTEGRLDGNTLVVSFGHYLSKLEATLKDGQLEGKLSGRFERDRYISSYPFRAQRYAPVAVTTENVPSIDGVWEIPYNSPKGEKSWRFIVQQEGPEVSAAILRVDGDTGSLTGRLIAGAPIEMWEKVPQAENLNSWPTTFFVGRDGRVKLIHAGFAAPASGEFHVKLKEKFIATIERLLAEDVTAAR
jgi:hypothetical protein